MRFSHAKAGLIGAVLWISSIQYFIVQAIVIAAWTVPHSFKNHYISDLGNTVCGMYAGLAVCSPLHPLMNASFVVFGVTMAAGSYFMYTWFKKTKPSAVGFILMAVAGFGTILVGLFPENTISSLHIVGAVLGLGIGNVSIIILGMALRGLHPLMRIYSVASGSVSLAAFVLFASEIYLLIGRGGMERLVSYPFTMWMIILGLYIAAIAWRRSRLSK
jgi:hypothetical membrane protein